MQTDPNPSNFFYDRQTKRLNLVDFGAVHRYDYQFIDNYIEVVKSASLKDKESVIDISKDLGFLTGEENDIMKQAHTESVLTVGEPFSYDGEFDFGAQNLTKKTY